LEKGCKGKHFRSRPDVARHFNFLYTLPKKGKARAWNRKTPKEGIEVLASYLVDCSGEKDLVDSWFAFHDRTS